MKVFAFIGLNWSVHRVILGIEKQLQDYEFRYLESGGSYTVKTFFELYNWCDVIVTNLETIRVLKSHFPNINYKHILFVSHGPQENKVVKDYDSDSIYGFTCDCLLPMFPKGLKLYYTPNGVDDTLFKYRPRDGTIKTLGWCGAPNIPYKRVEWAHEIAKRTGLQLKIGFGMSLDETVDWYQTIDIHLTTAIIDSTGSETGPLPPFEAIASGALAIGTPVGNFKNLPLSHLTTIDEFVKLIKVFQENPDLVKSFSRSQYEKVMKTYTYKVLAPYWKTALDELVIA